MAGDQVQPLSADEAKARLRLAARETGLRAWMHQSPWGLIGLALGSGFLAGRLPAARSTMIWTLARAMLSLTQK